MNFLVLPISDTSTTFFLSHSLCCVFALFNFGVKKWINTMHFAAMKELKFGYGHVKQLQEALTKAIWVSHWYLSCKWSVSSLVFYCKCLYCCQITLKHYENSLRTVLTVWPQTRTGPEQQIHHWVKHLLKISTCSWHKNTANYGAQLCYFNIYIYSFVLANFFQVSIYVQKPTSSLLLRCIV